VGPGLLLLLLRLSGLCGVAGGTEFGAERLAAGGALHDLHEPALVDDCLEGIAAANVRVVEEDLRDRQTLVSSDQVLENVALRLVLLDVDFVPHQTVGLQQLLGLDAGGAGGPSEEGDRKHHLVIVR
jgi:hypothetical protein